VCQRMHCVQEEHSQHADGDHDVLPGGDSVDPLFGLRRLRLKF
jgi:hypothetical protein